MSVSEGRRPAVRGGAFGHGTSAGPGIIRGVDVIDHQPAGWFLLRDGDDLFLDVNCTHGAVGYSWLIMLDGPERRAYQDDGRIVLHRLARAIQDSDPGGRGTTSVYRDRDLTGERGQEVLHAVGRRRETTGGTTPRR